MIYHFGPMLKCFYPYSYIFVLLLFSSPPLKGQDKSIQNSQNSLTKKSIDIDRDVVIDILPSQVAVVQENCSPSSAYSPYVFIKRFFQEFSPFYFVPDQSEGGKNYAVKAMEISYVKKDKDEMARVLSEEELKNAKIHFHWVHDGRLYDLNGNLWDTHGREYIFVMNEKGEIFIHPGDSSKGFFHSSFFAGAPVASAGTIVIKKGKIQFLSNLSGHYKPSKELFNQVLTELESREACTDEQVPVRYFSF